MNHIVVEIEIDTNDFDAWKKGRNVEQNASNFNASIEQGFFFFSC